ncbi:Thymidylate kinase [endosymbiont GvMRE of Glomus versiforme]|nr:Thymidylate kinase [endosymbiont GvMRE of Glomus versiforme]
MHLLVSFEGIDGSGKTSVVRKLSEKLPNSFATKEPRGTKLGERVWQLTNESLKNKELVIDSQSQLFLFAAAHNEHLKIIRQQLSGEKDKIVLVDRYIDSTFVYQGLRGNLTEEQKKSRVNLIKELFQKFINTRFPDLTFILNLEPEKAQARLEKREEKNNWDKLDSEFHQQIRQGYLDLKKYYFPERNYHIINADRPLKEIVEEIYQIIINFQTNLTK